MVLSNELTQPRKKNTHWTSSFLLIHCCTIITPPGKNHTLEFVVSPDPMLHHYDSTWGKKPPPDFLVSRWSTAIPL